MGLKLIRLVPSKKRKGLYQCSCGNQKEVFIYSVRSGKTRSCGCLRRRLARERHLKHGHAGRKAPTSSTYNSWRGMKERCANPNNKTFGYYGGRGIKVCKRWNTFGAFLADMGQRPKGKTLDRINGDGSYKPSNCRWASWKTQNNPLHKREYGSAVC